MIFEYEKHPPIIGIEGYPRCRIGQRGGPSYILLIEQTYLTLNVYVEIGCMRIFNRTSRASASEIQYLSATFLLAMNSMMIGIEELFQTVQQNCQLSRRGQSLRMLGQYN